MRSVPAAIEATWACDVLIHERIVTFTEAETTLSLDDMQDLLDGLEYRNALAKDAEPGR